MIDKDWLANYLKRTGLEFPPDAIDRIMADDRTQGLYSSYVIYLNDHAPAKLRARISNAWRQKVYRDKTTNELENRIMELEQQVRDLEKELWEMKKADPRIELQATPIEGEPE